MSSVPRVCSACGAASAWDARFCQQCGRPLDEDAMPRYYGVLSPGPAFVLGSSCSSPAVIALVAGNVDRGDPAARVRRHRLRLLLPGGAAQSGGSRCAPVFSSGTAFGAGRGSRMLRSTAWMRAARDVVRLRRESRSLRREREPVLRSLGDAATATTSRWSRRSRAHPRDRPRTREARGGTGGGACCRAPSRRR